MAQAREAASTREAFPEPHSRADVAAYLHFGYLPRVPTDIRALPWARVRPSDVRAVTGLPRAELLREGLAAFQRACGQPGDGLQVVPLSGGIDSRLILATLLACVPRERLRTVTFGIPGTFDYEIARAVARAAGVEHEAVDLSGAPTTRAELLATCRRAPWAYVFEAHDNQRVQARFGSGATYWSGILANGLAGADLRVVCTGWADACRRFAAATRIARSLDLAPPGFRPESVLPERPILEDSVLTPYEQLYLFVRYPGRIDPAALPPGFDVRTPFREPAWVEFMLRIPAAMRAGEGFYREIARQASPELFALPVKNCLGFPLGTPAWRLGLRRARLRLERELCRRHPRLFRRTNPKLNYADVDAELRRSSDLARVVEDSLRRLVSLGLVDWLDPMELWRRHQAHGANHGDALAVLAALELNLAAESGPGDAPDWTTASEAES